MIERLKGYFMRDITQHNGWLTSTILSFHNKFQSEQFINMRDSAIDCLIYRIWAIFDEQKIYLVNRIIPPCIQQRSSDLHQRRKWWYENRHTVDFYLPGNNQISVCLLSNYSSVPIIDQLHLFLST